MNGFDCLEDVLDWALDNPDGGDPDFGWWPPLPGERDEFGEVTEER